VAVFDRLITDTAQRGYYLVYLLRRDGDGLYLSLNQGTTAVHAEVGGRRYLGVLRDRAAMYAELLSSEGLNGLQLGPIDLGGGGTLTRGYEAGNVAAQYYDAKALPADAKLQADLRRFIALYRRLVDANDHLTDADMPTAQSEQEADESVRALEAKRLRWHLRAERNPKLVAEAKRVHGSTCSVCGFEFAARYGQIGEGYIEAHHLTPFSELDGRPTQLDARHDFAVVCANCHRMIHRKRPPYTLLEVMDRLR
jgi:5-methylcytosine-specific restriction enzyme A